MLKRMLSGFLASALLLCGTAFAEEAVEGSVVLPVSAAVFTEGKGVSPENKKVATAYDESLGLIVNIADKCEITYTVPEGVSGSYDIYLTVGEIMAQFTSQPFSFRVGGGAEFSVPIDCRVPADSIGAYHANGDDYNVGSFYDTGRFLISSGVTLNAGDTFTVLASFGAKGGNLKGKCYPAVGDVLLAPAGAQVAVGYDMLIPETVAADPSDPLSGLDILWIGSSVTYGAMSAGHYSMADAIADLHPATVCEKYAISATTLVNQSADSYVARMKLIPTDKTPDLVVIQLSTNDATTGKPFGTIAEGTDSSTFDDTTIAGAIETMIAYVQQTFHCPVAFYTGTYCEKENYGEMVSLLLDIQKKWDIGVIDMYNDAAMTAVFGTAQYDAWMGDQVHPNCSGYIEWWTPVIDAYLTDFMSGK